MRRHVIATMMMSVLAAGLAGCNAAGNDAAIQKWLQNARFQRLVPASTSFGPGNFVAKKDYVPGKTEPELRLEYLCDEGFVDAIKMIPPATTEDQTSSLSAVVGLEVPVSALAAMNLNVSAKYAQSVKLTIRNAVVLQYSLEGLQGIREFIASNRPKCRSIINEYVAAGNAHQVVQAIRASIAHEISFKPNLSVSVQQAIIKELGPVDVSVGLDKTQTVTGEGLYWGVYLAPLTKPL